MKEETLERIKYDCKVLWNYLKFLIPTLGILSLIAYMLAKNIS
jgi:hypothetical protein